MTNNLPFQMIATDLDRTLLRDDETLSPVTAEAICYAKQKGILFVVATARSLYSTMLVARDLRPDAVIHTGGAYAVVGDQTLYRAVLSAEATQNAACICLASPYVEHIRICGEQEDVTTNPAVAVGKSEFGHYRRISNTEIPSVFHQAATKLTVCSHQPHLVAALFENDTRYAFTPSRNTADFGHKLAHPAATKEAALACVAAHFGLALKDVCAFGDDLADLGMLSLCGRGIAVANAVPEVRNIADAVCLSNEEDGVAKYLMQILR